MKKLLLLLVAICMVQFSLFAQTTEFLDDFESGTANWTLEGAWGLTTTQSNSPSNSLTDSPAGNYTANQNISATMASGVDLSAALDAELKFSAIYDIEGGNFDYCYVEASGDGGANWINVATFLGEDNLTPWVDYTYSLGGFAGNSDVRVRFRFFSDGGYEVDGIYIDDVEIISYDTDNAAPLVLHTPPEFYESNIGDVVMLAELIDISGIGTANLFYSVDGGAAQSIAGVDLGNNQYGWLIPGQAAGAQVDYYLEVADASTNANVTTTPTYSYIDGAHVIYDDATVDFVNVFGPAAASGLAGCAVRFTLYGSDIKYALIRNYTDINRPNDDFMFHVWADDNGLPGADLITPFSVTPEATLTNNSPMTRVDLSAYAAELSGITGDVFVGYTVPAGETWLVQTTPAVGNRTYNFDGTNWTLNDDDYHFRIVTTASVAADDCADATDLSNLLGGAVDVPVASPLFDNTDAMGNIATDSIPGTECFDDQTFEHTQWYTFVGDGNAYNIATAQCGSTNYIDFGDTQMAVFSGDDCGNLTPVACNEDTDFGNNIFSASVNIETEMGTNYYILIDGWDGADGEYCVEFTSIALIGCDDIAVGAASTDTANVCFGSITSFNLGDGTMIPDIGPTRGFRWIVTTADVTGSADPFADPSYTGAFGEVTSIDDVYTPQFLNDGTQLPAGDYYFTPVVYAGGTGTIPNADFTDGCVATGTSVFITLLPQLDALSATTSSVNEVTPPGNNGEASVTASGGSGSYSYSWSNGGDTPTITGLASDTYTVTVSDDTGCVDDFVVEVVVDVTVSAEELAFENAIELYPNPAKEITSVQFTFAETMDLQISLTNSLGQIIQDIQRANVQAGTVDLDLQGLTNGVYFVKLSNGEQQTTRRLVVRK